MILESVEVQSLVSGCKKGDSNCQRKVYEKLYSQMLGVSLRYMGNMDDAKDILQEGFIKVFNNIHKYSDEGSFVGWVRRIISNTALDALRKSTSSKVFTDSEKVENTQIENEEEFNWFEENQITPEKIHEEIRGLSPAYRTVFNMYIIEGYSHKEIAEQLNISEGSSKSNLFKAKARLKERLTAEIEKINS